jgi:uncharacterized membrane protein
MSSNSRIIALDNLRGIAFIFMLIQHIFYFYDVSNLYSTSYAKNIFIDYSGIIARSMFILLAGISLSLIKDKKNNLEKRFKRSSLILFYAFSITIVTYLMYPDFFIKFGILHFIGIATLFCSFLTPYPILMMIIILIALIIKIPSINPLIDTITGAKANFIMMDWFPLFPWIALILLGILIGQNEKLLSNLTKIEFLNQESILTFLGENSLELYTVHIILLILFYAK